MQNGVTATNHTSFTVANLDRAIALFTDGLGFSLTSRAGRDARAIQIITGVAGAEVEIAYLAGPDHTVELVEYKAPDDRRIADLRPCDVGFAHIAFDVLDIDATILHLTRYGANPIAQPYLNNAGPNTGVRVAYLRTADRIAIELIERPA